jgi:predicted NAD/FAD-binding protein
MLLRLCEVLPEHMPEAMAVIGALAQKRIAAWQADRRAILLGRYFLAHAHIAFDSMGASESLRVARRLWRFVETRRVQDFSKSEVWQAMKGGTIERAADLDAGLDLLIEHRLIRRRRTPRGAPGRQPEAYDVNPAAIATRVLGE